VTQREREPLTDPDPHTLLFGHDDDVVATEHPSGEHPIAGRPSRRMDRHEKARRRRLRRHRRVFLILTTLLVIVTAVLGYTAYRIYQNRYHPKDFSGAGTGAAVVVVHAGDAAKAIGTTLHDKSVVASVRAFTNAAADNSNSQDISPGTYKLRLHMSAKNAVALLLDPATRLTNRVLVAEGATVVDVVAPLAKALGISQAAVRAAMQNVQALGLPQGYTSDAKPPASVEGFLYPATYTFDPGTKVTDALQKMITQFTDQARSSGFTADAKALKITPYNAVIIASIIEREAKNATDYPKVARVILNRLAAGMPLQIDATTRYGALLNGVDPNKIAYATYSTPYNSYTHHDLPPTPIASPGEIAMRAAVHPAAGNWLYYVNGDAQGDLTFTTTEADFAKAQLKCYQHSWGCAAP
jgi:UPF0755 protein